MTTVLNVYHVGGKPPSASGCEQERGGVNRAQEIIKYCVSDYGMLTANTYLFLKVELLSFTH